MKTPTPKLVQLGLRGDLPRQVGEAHYAHRVPVKGDAPVPNIQGETYYHAMDWYLASAVFGRRELRLAARV